MTSISPDKQEEKIYSQREVDELYKKWIHDCRLGYVGVYVVARSSKPRVLLAPRTSEMQLSHVLPCLSMSCLITWSEPQNIQNSSELRMEQHVTPLLEELEELRAELERMGLKRRLDLSRFLC